MCTHLASPRSSCTLTLWSMYNLLINLLSRQSIPVLFRVCINLVQWNNVPGSLIFQHVCNSLTTGPVMPIYFKTLNVVLGRFINVDIWTTWLWVTQGYRYTYVVKETVSLKGNSLRLMTYGSDISFFLNKSTRKILLEYHWPCKIWPQITVLELIIVFIYIFYHIFIY